MKKFFLLLAFLAAVTTGCSATNTEFATKEEVSALRSDVGRLATGAERTGKILESHQKSLEDYAAAINGHEERLKTTESSLVSQAHTVSGLNNRLGKVELGLAKTNETVAQVQRSVEAVGERLALLEKRITGVRRMTEGRIGTLEDQGGIDHKTRLLRLSGFATKSFDLTVTMKRRLDEMIALVKKGEWSISSVVGFADTVPYLDKDKKDWNPELARNRAKSVAQYLADAIGKIVPFEKRGATSKFGDQDMNRSVLVHLDRVAPVAPAPAALPPSTKTP